MTYKYKFWSKVLNPIDRVFNFFGYYIIFSYSENQKDLFDRFSEFKICHYSKLDTLNNSFNKK